MRLLLIRHGQTPSNVLGLLDTEPPGPGLTALGQEQADAVPARVVDEPIELLYVSTALRTQETARPLAAARGLEPVIRDGAREIAAGDWEMAGDPQSVQGYMGAVGKWMSGDLDLSTPGLGGESGAAVMDRFDRVVREIEDHGVAGAAIVAHGAVIRLWSVLRSINLDLEFGHHTPLGNTGVVVLDGSMKDVWTCGWWTGAQVGVTAGPAGQATP